MRRPHAPRAEATAFHGSREPLAIGTLLEPRGRNLLDGDIEDFLEASRPAHRLSRRAAVYATPALDHLDNLGVNFDHVYRVTTVEPVVLDHAYANRIWHIVAENEEALTDGHRGTIALLARLYWSGQRANFPGRAGILCPYAPEILCRSALIDAAVDELVA
jgi:hypothetical protein